MIYIFIMHQTNLNGLDLNLLPPLEALLRLRNVTLAAREAGMSQPAMSRALGRLRHVFKDPLLVRGRKGLMLTPRAIEVAAILGPTLQRVQHVFADPQFDPAKAQRQIRIAASDVHNALILPHLIALLVREAPGLDIVCEPYGPNLVEQMFAGTLDFAFALDSTPLPTGAHSVPLARDELTLVMRHDHPLAGHDWTVQDYGRVPHVLIGLLNDGVSEMDAWLAAEGVSRTSIWSSPHFLAALATVAQTDAVTTVSRAFASRFGPGLGLILKRPPFAHIDFGIVLVGSQAQARDPLMLWLANKMRQAAQLAYGVETGRSQDAGARADVGTIPA